MIYPFLSRQKIETAVFSDTENYNFHFLDSVNIRQMTRDNKTYEMTRECRLSFLERLLKGSPNEEIQFLWLGTFFLQRNEADPHFCQTLEWVSCSRCSTEEMWEFSRWLFTVCSNTNGKLKAHSKWTNQKSFSFSANFANLGYFFLARKWKQKRTFNFLCSLFSAGKYLCGKRRPDTTEVFVHDDLAPYLKNSKNQSTVSFVLFLHKFVTWSFNTTSTVINWWK